MNPASPRLYLERPGPMTAFLGLCRQTFVSAYENNCFGIAKGAAYSTLLAFFPILASIAAILARVNADSVARVFSRLLFEVVPPGSQDLVRTQFAAHAQRPFWLIVGAVLLSTWAASGAVVSLMEGFQAAYRLPTDRPFLKQRAVAVFLVFIAVLPAVGSSTLIVFGARTEQWMLGWLGLSPEADVRTGVVLLFGLLRYAVALGATVFVTALMYCIAPNRPLKLRAVWPGRSWRPFFGWLRRQFSAGMSATSPITACCTAASAR